MLRENSTKASKNKDRKIAVELIHVEKQFPGMTGPALDDVNIRIAEGEFVTVLGSSGCGKTTLLSLLGRLDSPSDGRILFREKDIMKKGLAWHRRHNVAFVFQSYNLIDYMTAVENVA